MPIKTSVLPPFVRPTVVRPSVRLSVRPFVHASVRPSVRPSVLPCRQTLPHPISPSSVAVFAVSFDAQYMRSVLDESRTRPGRVGSREKGERVEQTGGRAVRRAGWQAGRLADWRTGRQADRHESCYADGRAAGDPRACRSGRARVYVIPTRRRTEHVRDKMLITHLLDVQVIVTQCVHPSIRPSVKPSRASVRPFVRPTICSFDVRPSNAS